MTNAVPPAGIRTAPGTRSRPGFRRVGAVLALLVGSVALLGPAAGAAPSLTSLGSADDPIVTFGLQPVQTKGQPFRANFDLDLKPGEEKQDSVRVRNNSSGQISLNVYATDALNAQGGAVDLLPTADKPKDIGTWVSLGKNAVTISANDFVDIPFTIKVPSGAEPGDHIGGIVASYLDTSPATTQGQVVRLDRRIGTRVQIRVAGALTPELNISNLKADYHNSWNPIGRGSTTLSYRVTNNGNVRMGVDQKIRVASPFGFPSKTVNPDPIAELLPGNSVEMSQEISGILPTIRSGVKVTVSPRASREGDTFPPNVAASAKTGMWTLPFAFIIALIIILAGLKWRREQQRRRLEAAATHLEQLVDARVGGPDANGFANGNGNPANGNGFAPDQTWQQPQETQHPTQPGGQA